MTPEIDSDDDDDEERWIPTVHETCRFRIWQDHQQYHHGFGIQTFNQHIFIGNNIQYVDKMNSPVTPPAVDDAASMDSFVRDHHDVENSSPRPIQMEPLPDISAIQHLQPILMAERRRSHSSDAGSHASSACLPPPKPAHDFFQGYEQDSDASAHDDSIVFQPIRTQQQHPMSRNRLPSLESVGSHGSARLVSPRQGPKRSLPRPTNTNNNNNTPISASFVKPHLLPYSERRKLLQQRNAQRQQQHSQRRNVMAMQTPSPQQQQPRQHPNVIQQQSPSYSMPELVAGLTVTDVYPTPISSSVLQAQATTNSLLSPWYGYPPPPSQGDDVADMSEQNIALPLTPTQPAHPLTLKRQQPSGSSMRYATTTIDHPVLRNNDEEQPLQPPRHVRHDSIGGSVSSLGSIDRSGRYDEDDIHIVSNGFLEEWTRGAMELARTPVTPWMSQSEPEQESSLLVFQPQVIHPPPPPPPSSLRVHEPSVMKSPDPLNKKSRQGKSTERQHHQVLDGKQRATRVQIAAHVQDNRSDSTVSRHQKQRHRMPRRKARGKKDWESSSSHDLSSSPSSSSSFSALEVEQPGEQTRLLPPPGASTSEHMDTLYTEDQRRRMNPRGQSYASSRGDMWSIAEQGRMGAIVGSELRSSHPTEMERNKWQNKRKTKKNSKHHRKKHRSRNARSSVNVPSDSSLTSDESKSKDHWMGRRQRMLDIERARLIKQWKAEAREEELAKRQKNRKPCCHVVFRQVMTLLCKGMDRMSWGWRWTESLIANLPLTLAVIALAIANLGVNWFKLAEEHDPGCIPVHFHSSQCAFPEFPGCYYCNTHASAYKFALNLHWTCSVCAGLLAMMLLVKLICYHRIVLDELSSPTTAAPAGVLCMVINVVFAGRGMLGMGMVATASTIHLGLAVWFIYMALAYHIMPEPSWFPNTVEIGLSAMKTWLYFPTAGQFLMAISLSLNFFFFPTSLVRVALNPKISATIGWMQMSAPDVSLYALTIMAQPSFEEEHPDVTSYQRIHRLVYLPSMHFIFGLVVVGMLASVTSLISRWRTFRHVPFSPGHAAFCNPCLNHAKALQAYRAAVTSFSGLPRHHPYLVFLYWYWVLALVLGTLITLGIAARFFWNLPQWTHFDYDDMEPPPPAPYETTMSLSHLINAGDTLVQPFISPAILQANETGQMIFIRDTNGEGQFRRTRQVAALGFEPLLEAGVMEDERELLIDFVDKNPRRRRQRTLSVPGIDFNYNSQVGRGSGIYDNSVIPPKRLDFSSAFGEHTSREDSPSSLIWARFEHD